MASISKEPGGRRTIQFVGGDGKRRSIRLGKVSQRLAESVQVRVEHLAAAQVTGVAWTAKPPDGWQTSMRNLLTNWQRSV